MTKNENIHIKLEISKDITTGSLCITTHFNKEAPNFLNDQEGYYWIPTIEEKDFLNEAFSMVTTKDYTPSYTKVEEEKTEKPDILSEAAEKEKEVNTENISQNESEVTVFEVADENKSKNEKTGETDNKKNTDPNSPENVFIAADDDAIEAALRKNQGKKDEKISQADDQRIIDKVLKQKKKWQKEKDKE